MMHFLRWNYYCYYYDLHQHAQDRNGGIFYILLKEMSSETFQMEYDHHFSYFRMAKLDFEHYTRGNWISAARAILT